MPIVELSPGHFSDTGYRFRKNTFYRKDEWYPLKETENQFYDLTIFNSDIFKVDLD